MIETPEPPTTSTIRTLLRLWPHARPDAAYLIGSGVAGLMATLAGLGIPLVVQRLIDGPLSRSDRTGVLVLGAVALGLGIVESLLILLRRLLSARPSARVEFRMRATLYEHLQRLPIAFHDRWPSGQLLSRAVSDLTIIRRWVGFMGIYTVVNALVVLIGFGILLALAPPLGLVMLVTSIPMVLLSRRWEKSYGVAALRSQNQVGDLTTAAEEATLGVRVIRAFGRGPALTEAFRTAVQELRSTELVKLKVLALLYIALIALPGIGLAAMIGVGGLGVAGGDLTVGTAVAAVTVLIYLQQPIESLGWLITEGSEAAAASARYHQVLDTRPTVLDPTTPRGLPTPVRGEVRFDDVRFRFDEGPEILRGVDLTIHPGETVALVGATGSGKSALTSLVGRLADVTGGAVRIDGVDVRDLRLDELRRVVATAFEEPSLFSASVRENVVLGSREATDDEVWAALRVARADDFVAELEWGLDTRVGEQGHTLSGGQRQRLALARAVLGRPSVLVLDDPLSALDVHTEAEVEAALRRVLGKVSALVVAHRPSTVLLADRVALLEDGRIAAVGTHRELLTSIPRYRDMLTALDAAGTR